MICPIYRKPRAAPAPGYSALQDGSSCHFIKFWNQTQGRDYLSFGQVQAHYQGEIEESDSKSVLQRSRSNFVLSKGMICCL